MLVVIVARQPCAQLAMQRQQVEHVLQIVAVLEHRLGHGLLGVAGWVGAQPVGLVVDHVVTALMLENQIDEALEQPVQPVAQQRRPGLTIQRVRTDQLIDAQHVDPLRSEHELHFHLILRNRQIGLEMMACLLDALPLSARLILLGDKDQLASVEAGAVLGDLCRDADAGFYSDDTRHWLEAVSGDSLQTADLKSGDAERHPLAQQTVMLRHSHRFGADSGIGELARTVNRMDGAAARQVLDGRQFADLRSHLLRGPDDPAMAQLMLGDTALPGYASYLQVLAEQRPAAELAALDPGWEAWAQAVLRAFDQFQVLCAVRKGPWGVEGLNQSIAELLHRRRLLPSPQGWYEGRPVLVTRNDYSLGLMNGDIGIALRVREPALQPGEPERMALRVAFPRNDGSGGLRFVLPSRLNDVETVFAMTVHKSQGSEFAHALLALPESRSPVLTKELVYTAITRASRHFTLLETRQGIFEEAVAQRVRRASGLQLQL